MSIRDLCLVLAKFKEKEYWTPVNTVEFISFVTKLAIIIPGLLFGVQIWWLYIIALTTSCLLIWTSTKKTLPTIILFNLGWVILASISLYKHLMM